MIWENKLFIFFPVDFIFLSYKKYDSNSLGTKFASSYDLKRNRNYINSATRRKFSVPGYILLKVNYTFIKNTFNTDGQVI